MGMKKQAHVLGKDLRGEIGNIEEAKTLFTQFSILKVSKLLGSWPGHRKN